MVNKDKFHRVKNLRFENDVMMLVIDGKQYSFPLKEISARLYKAPQIARETIEKQRTAVIEFFELWQQRRTDPSDEWQKSFNKAANRMMLWCPDDVLYHFAMYLKPAGEETSDAEIHFGRSVLRFRKTLGYRNWGKKITPEHIVRIYSVANPDAAK